jgi:hypothetical protein
VDCELENGHSLICYSDDKVPVAIQFIPAIGIFATVPFCPGRSTRYSSEQYLIADVNSRVAEVAFDEWPRHPGS